MKRLTYITLLLMMWCWGTAQAALTIEITRGVSGASPIAIVPFGVENAQPGVDVSAVISGDLYRSGRFAPLPEKDLISRPHDGKQVVFQDWRLLAAPNLVVGKVKGIGDDLYEVRFQLFDVFKAKQLTGYVLRAKGDRLRQVAHQISDIIYEQLTGEPGVFTTRIAYITATTAGNKQRYSLQIADVDGYNPRKILNSPHPIMSPSWSPDGRKLAYVSFEKRRSQIYVQELATGKRKMLTSFEGINGAPAWSPDGKQLALTLSREGNPEIYIMNLADGALQRITRNYAIDTEPVWAPNGKSVVFTSDRGGTPQLYQYNLADGSTKRLTFEGKYNTRASFSPDGSKIAMVHRENSHYQIAVMDMETGIMQVLTDARLDESPSFAPNGSMIIYATEHGGKGVLAAVSVDGSVTQRLALQEGDVREPAWSPKN